MESQFLLLGLIATVTVLGLYAMGKDSNPPPDNIRFLRRVYWLPIVLLAALMFALTNPATALGAAFILLFGAGANAIYRTNFFIIPFTGGRTMGPILKGVPKEKPDIEEILNRSHQASNETGDSKVSPAKRIRRRRRIFRGRSSN